MDGALVEIHVFKLKFWSIALDYFKYDKKKCGSVFKNNKSLAYSSKYFAKTKNVHFYVLFSSKTKAMQKNLKTPQTTRCTFNHKGKKKTINITFVRHEQPIHVCVFLLLHRIQWQTNRMWGFYYYLDDDYYCNLFF